MNDHSAAPRLRAGLHCLSAAEELQLTKSEEIVEQKDRQHQQYVFKIFWAGREVIHYVGYGLGQSRRSNRLNAIGGQKVVYL